jgi:hypothetical protein
MKTSPKDPLMAALRHFTMPWTYEDARWRFIGGHSQAFKNWDSIDIAWCSYLGLPGSADTLCHADSDTNNDADSHSDGNTNIYTYSDFNPNNYAYTNEHTYSDDHPDLHNHPYAHL